MWLDEELTIRLDRFTPVATRIVVETPSPTEPGLELSGQIVGPHSAHARTLPATLRFRSEVVEQGLRAATTFPDFCGWSADYPHRYRVTVELRRGREVLESVTRDWGAALLGPRRHHFYWEGRRWVMRAVEPARNLPLDIDACRAVEATCIRENPTFEECLEADRRGLRLVARIPVTASSDFAQLARRLRPLADHPSVIFVWLDHDEQALSLPASLSLPSSLRLATTISPAQPDPLPTWASVGIVSVDQLTRPGFSPEAWETLSKKPILVRQSWPGTSIDQQRRRCDQLQAAVATRGEFAGFLIQSVP